MKNFYFDNFGNNSFLVYKLNNEEIIDEISLSMILNNDMTGVLKAIVNQFDDEKFIKYNITSKVQASLLFADNVNKKRVLDVFEQIVKAAIEVENYLIPVERLLFNLEYIYVDVATNETSLICLPIEEQNEKVDLKEFFKNILFNAKFDQKENNDYVGRLINSLNSMLEFSNDRFLQAIYEIRGIKSEDLDNEKNKNISNEKKVQRVENNIPITNPVNNAVIKEESSFSSDKTVEEDKPKEEKKKGFISMPNFKKNKVEDESIEEDIEEDDEEKITLMSLLTGFSGEKFKKYKEQRSKNKGKKNTKKYNNNNKKDIRDIREKFNKKKFNEEIKEEREIEKKPEEEAPKQIVKGRYGDFGDTTVLGNDSGTNETTVLSESMDEEVYSEKRPFLIRQKNNERILIDSDIFKIGSEQSYVNYHIYDNTSISRSHAIISKDADNYFIEDTNSTNHTYVNGSIITPNTKIEINDNDEIKLADEKFKFTLI
ncbi:FHA domain-containing protein [Helcococcus kunzii]|uniref:FHA domain-containing protein n=1 Tax=Helcococcus kunzii TaxID=40091 RepID=UPI0021A33A04|nr:FHA domain-containing protein [Helcococcus kunzii]MCT1795984.1 FHA domain-containing protein [Helcococcus kunzii]MCT1988240.1 FHA domain-containing protein [Helcococcus kunzii]